MLENIIRNPIETSRGYKNSGNGIALRGPLSQFFSGIFLKKLDDAFDNMQVNYLRYQDDIIILCKTHRQLNRCRRRMMEILHERGLSLSRKKSRMGCVSRGFHFLSVYYPPTQTEDNIKATHANDASISENKHAHYLSEWGGKMTIEHQRHEPISIVPHPRTIRKAREHVKVMVKDGVSLKKIHRYLHRFVIWWVVTSNIWTYEELLGLFIQTCWDPQLARIGYGLMQVWTESRTRAAAETECSIAA